MNLDPAFAYNPNVSPTPGPPLPTPPPAPDNSDLGPLALLPGVWKGTGFNTIWRPDHDPAQDRFLELNITQETIEFDRIPGTIPNRGLLQNDLSMVGVRYLQQISDANIAATDPTNAGLHIEPGLWLAIPPTTDPDLGASVARLASIPHGTTIVAQGSTLTAPKPLITATNINPFPIGNLAGAKPFPEQDLNTPTQFRSATTGLQFPITQGMVDNPNSVLTAAIAQQNITSTVVLIVSSAPTPVPGGGTANTAFLQGTVDGPNADAALVTAIFWLETIEGQAQPQLQYTQTVLLSFNGLSWPHITVATLTKQP